MKAATLRRILAFRFPLGSSPDAGDFGSLTFSALTWIARPRSVAFLSLALSSGDFLKFGCELQRI